MHKRLTVAQSDMAGMIRRWLSRSSEVSKSTVAVLAAEGGTVIPELEIMLPTGIILSVRGEPTRRWQERPETQAMLMQRLQRAIALTDWDGVRRVYGMTTTTPQYAPPAQIEPPVPMQTRMSDIAEAARSKRATPKPMADINSPFNALTPQAT